MSSEMIGSATFDEALMELSHMIRDRYGFGPEVKDFLQVRVVPIPDTKGEVTRHNLVAYSVNEAVTPENVLWVYCDGPLPQDVQRLSLQ